ncbi:MAG: hypothetical protein JNM93_12590 [Bacteriovoracaceae bacterium]|nr:hypothetical protein [Bacteriovoracaceae bacterium]
MNDLIADIEKKVKEFLKQVPFLNNLVFGKNTEADSSEDQAGNEGAGDKTSVSRVNVLANAQEEAGPDGEKPKFKLKRVHIIALGIIAYLLVDDQLLNFNPPPTDPAQAKKIEEQNLAKIKAAIDKIPEAKPIVQAPAPVEKVEVAPPAVVETPVAEPEQAPVVEETAPVEEVAIETPGNFTEPEIVGTETIEISETLPTETETIETPTEPVISADVTEPTMETETPVAEEVVSTEELGQSEGSVSDVTPPQNVTEDILEDLENQFSQKTQDRNEKLFYSIPRYEFIGRGLVYSCTGKHWACVNAENYGKCEKNYNFLKNIDRSKECYPAEVYATNEDCSTAQQSKVDSTPKYEFCQ